MTSETRFVWAGRGRDAGVGRDGGCREVTSPHPSGEGNVPDPEHHHGVSGVR